MRFTVATALLCASCVTPAPYKPSEADEQRRRMDEGQTGYRPPGQQLGISTVDATDGDRPALVVVAPTERIAQLGDGYRVVRVVDNETPPTVETVGGRTLRGSAKPVRVRSPQMGELKVGDLVFYSLDNPQSLSAARAAVWQLAKIEQIDSLAGRIKIGGAFLSPDFAVLIPQ